MKNKIVMILTGFVILSLVVIAAIHYFGEERVGAFGSVMSFIATAIAAVAAVGYLIVTFDMIKVMKAAAEEQARVTRIMEADLRYRITPHLQFNSLGGTVDNQPGEVHNIGRGVAEEVTGVVTYVPSDRQQELQLPGWIEPNKCRNVRTHQRPNETGFSVRLSCTDSVKLNTYVFIRYPDGRIDIKSEPRQTKI